MSLEIMKSDSYMSLICILLSMQPLNHEAVFTLAGVIKAEDMNMTDVNTNISQTQSCVPLQTHIQPETVPCFFVNQGEMKSFIETDFQEAYCSARCNGTEVITIPSPERCPGAPIRCYPCDCNRPQCEAYGTCCPNMMSMEEFTKAQVHEAQRRPKKQPNRNTVHETLRKAKHTTSSDNNSSQGTPGLRLFSKPSRRIKVKCDEKSLQDTKFLYIRSCPVGVADQHIRRLCEDDLPVDEQTIETFARVSDNVTGIVYYNKYCAECQQLLRPTAWDIAISCEHYLRVYSVRSKDELFKLSLHMDSLCTIQQQHPPGIVTNSCQSVWHEHVIASCNETGQWSATDTNIAAKCEHNSQVSLRVHVTRENAVNRYYNNIFCAFCNSDSNFLHRYSCILQYGFDGCCFSEASFKCDAQGSGMSGRKILPFSLLLGSLHAKNTKSPESGMKFKVCGASEWPSPDGTCLPLQCTAGKSLVDGNCTTAISDITGLGYRLNVLYLPNDTQSNHMRRENSSEILGLFMAHLQEQQIFSQDVAEYEMTVSFVWEESNSGNMRAETSHITSDATVNFIDRNTTSIPPIYYSHAFFNVEAYIAANKSISRDRFENTYLTPFLKTKPELLLEDHLTVLLALWLVPQVSELLDKSCHFPKEKSDIKKLETQQTCNQTDTNELIWHYKREFIFSSQVLTCVHVSFNKSQYTVSVNCSLFAPTWQIELDLGQIKLIFSDFSDLNRITVEEDHGNIGGNMRVCVDLLDETIQRIKANVRASQNSNIELGLYYLTHICLGLSMLTLLITLMVYLLFPSLRNEAGTNNMFLAGSLLLAQASLLASTHVDGPSVVCFTIAVSTHFLWLSMITWSFICCFHMFRVFTAKAGILKGTPSTQRNICIKKTVVGVIVPSSIVAMVMVSTYFTSGGERIGYTDSNPCYLESSLLAIISLATPLGVVTISNIYFFASTVHEIHKVKKLQTHSEVKKKETQTFIIYIKLSSLTGAFWAIAIISEHTNNDPLRFIAICLNGFQGVFLFLSFVCTKRVTRLIFQILKPEICSPKTSISKSTRESKDKTTEKSSTF